MVIGREPAAITRCRTRASGEIRNRAHRVLGAFAWAAKLALVILLLTLPATLQAQFTTTINSDGTIAIRKHPCTASALTIPHTIDDRRVTSIAAMAFAGCSGLTSVTTLWNEAFSGCRLPQDAYFAGDAPSVVDWNGRPTTDIGVDEPVTIRYLPGPQGWGTTFGNRPTAPWLRPNPTILDFGDRFGPSINGFGFVISWATNVPVVVEASADIGSTGWTPISTNRLTDGWVQFSDPNRKSLPARFYRVRGQ